MQLMALRSEELPDFRPMGKLEFEYVDCPVCKSNNRTEHFSKITGGYKIEFCICNDCRALYARNIVKESCLADMYGSQEFFSSGAQGSDIPHFDFFAGQKFLPTTARHRIRHLP